MDLTREAFEDVALMLEQGSWYELALDYGADPSAIYEAFLRTPGLVLTFHHFGDEPWHPGRWVVRAQVAPRRDVEFMDILDDLDGIIDVGLWSRVEDDRRLYGDYFTFAMQFFQTSSLLACNPNGAMTSKFVHCVLNAHGVGDLGWGVRYVLRRIRLQFWLAWQSILGRKWWEK